MMIPFSPWALWALYQNEKSLKDETLDLIDELSERALLVADGLTRVLDRVMTDCEADKLSRPRAYHYVGYFTAKLGLILSHAKVISALRVKIAVTIPGTEIDALTHASETFSDIGNDPFRSLGFLQGIWPYVLCQLEESLKG